MATMRKRHDRRDLATQPGFTLVELIAVIIVVGILGAAASARFLGSATFDSAAYTAQTQALMRYAQKVAVAQNRDVYVRLKAGGVALCYNATCDAGQRVLAPGGGNSQSAATRLACVDSDWACEAVPAKVTMTPALTFYFDPLGRPVAVPDVPGAPVSPFSTLALQVKASDSVRTITVEMETGYVH